MWSGIVILLFSDQCPLYCLADQASAVDSYSKVAQGQEMANKESQIREELVGEHGLSQQITGFSTFKLQIGQWH